MRPDAGPLAVVLNATSGGGRMPAAAERVAELCRAGGREVHLVVTRDIDELRRAVEAALAVPISGIVAGGGDGTISCVAGFLAGRDIPLGVLPLGTLNHFARDLGLPLGLDEAVNVVLTGETRRIDVGELNGRVFLNNSSLGLYPLIVRLRAAHPVRGPAKWAVALWATLREIRRRRAIALRINVAGEVILRHTPVLFIANNEYRAVGLTAASRDSLSDGRLAIYIVQAGGRRHLLRLAWRMLTNRVQPDDLELLFAEAVTIEPSAPRVPVSVDGEVESFAPPLEYRIRPGALRVMVPPVSAPSAGGLPQDRRYRQTATAPPR